MKYRAVIFDLFGTLVDVPSTSGLRRELAGMAAVLHLPVDDFTRLWFETSRQRSTGIFPDIAANVTYIVQSLGTEPDSAAINKAVELRYAYTRRLLTPRTDAVEVLSGLRRRGSCIGLISGCSIDVPHIWPDTALNAAIEVAVFSCAVGMNKPDPRIYALATQQLGVPPQDCLYVGDGANHELEGALKAGMHPVMIRVSYEADDDANRPDADEWTGKVITSLSEVPGLVE